MDSKMYRRCSDNGLGGNDNVLIDKFTLTEGKSAVLEVHAVVHDVKCTSSLINSQNNNYLIFIKNI